MTAAAPVLVALALGGAMMHVMPLLSRRDIFFAVTVSPEFRTLSMARVIRRDYWLLVWSATMAGVAVAVFGPGRGSVIAALAVQFVGSWAAWAFAHRRAVPFGIVIASDEPRVASLEPRPGIPGGPLVAMGPFVIVAVSALLLWINWDQIPDRFPSRWSADGTPIGWRTRSFQGVFGPLVMTAGAVTMMLWMAHAIGSGTRQVAATGIAALLERRFKRGHAVHAVLSAYIMVILMSLMSVRPVLAQTTRLPTPVWMLLAVMMAASFGFTAWHYRIGQGGRRQVPAGESVRPGDGAPDAAWKAGLFYYNPADPALLVEARMGWGWAINFGHVGAWVILALLLAATFGPMILRRLE